jgi:drug/metabolite transporter (DMT)-like permease
MAILLVVLSATVTALTNLLIRRGLGSSGDPFIFHRFLTAALFMIAVIFFRYGQVVIDYGMLAVGAVAGLALGLLQYTQGRSLNYGPAALSFIVVACASLLPPLIMYLLFGQEFGHDFTLFNTVGSLMVVGGLLWMATTGPQGSHDDKKRWITWVTAAFSASTLYQLILVWRALMLKDNIPDSPLVPFHVGPIESECFIVAMFFVAAICQLFMGARQAAAPMKKMLLCGIVGGILNASSGFLLVLSTESASSTIEKAIILPLNTVMLLSLCNLWANLLYKEKINWPANALSFAGIVVSSF